MSVVVPIVSASGAKSTVTLPDPMIGQAATTGPSPAYYAQWANSGVLQDPAFFVIGSWLTYLPRNNLIAPYGSTGYLGHALADAGFNTVYADYGWFDSAQYPSYALPQANLAQTYGLKMIVGWRNSKWFLTQNPALAPLIIGYFDQDEPDMVRGTYHDAHSAWQVAQNRAACRANDPTRPMFINVGKAFSCIDTGTFGLTQGSGYDTGSKNGDLSLYTNSVDAISIDTYWWTDDYEATTGAWMYGANVDNVRRFTANKALPIMGFVESSRQQTTNNGPTPDQMEQAIWNIIIHGARGLMYFNVDVKDGNAWDSGVWCNTYFNRTLGDQMIARMKTVNGRIKSLAPVLNSPQLGTVNAVGREVPTGITVAATNGIPVDMMVRQYSGKTYVFAQASGNSTHQASGTTSVTFTLAGGGSSAATVRDENRTVAMANGVWTDAFTAYQTHIYVIG